MQLNENIWRKKYKYAEDETPEDTFRRVARAAAKDDLAWEGLFFEEMNSLRFIPGGRILAAAGANKPKATLSNCFVMPPVPDDMSGIMDALKDGALTMQAGGGIGINFSQLRPHGALVGGTGSIASGPLDFMHMWNSMSINISGVGDRKGAMIAVLNCDHPDILKFISSKARNTKEHKVLEKFNISVGVTEEFIQAVKDDKEWELKHGEKVYEIVRARVVWDAIMENAHHKAEPGILFLSRINQMNNLWYVEKLDSTNPCGEQPLAPYGSCNLGAINLAEFVKDQFTEKAAFDFDAFNKTVQIGVRFLDDILDVNYYPLTPQHDDAMKKRKVGLGIMGLGSALAMLKIRYGTDESVEIVRQIMSTMRDTAYTYSVELAKEKGAFPLLDVEKYLDGQFLASLPDRIKGEIRKHGIRNANLLTVAPTGSIAQLAGNISSGVEPIYCLDFDRTNYGEDISIKDPIFQMYCETVEDVEAADAPDYFVDAHALTPEEHLKVMAECQRHIDSSISKTINMPKDISVKEMEHVYLLAYDLGCKGCTVYRDKSMDEEILKKKETGTQPPVKSFPSRPYKLEGPTFKVKVPDAKHAYYLTFTHILDENGRKQPYEMFIRTKDPNSEEWTKALGRLISAVFRSSDNATFVAEELQDVLGHSGFFSSHRHKFVPSLVAEFGNVIADYFTDIGLMEAEVPIEVYAAELNGGSSEKQRKVPQLAYCRKCGKHSVIFQEGCMKCINPSCLDSRCG